MLIRLKLFFLFLMISHSYAQSKHQFEYANPEAKGYSSRNLLYKVDTKFFETPLNKGF